MSVELFVLSLWRKLEEFDLEEAGSNYMYEVSLIVD